MLRNSPSIDPDQNKRDTSDDEVSQAGLPVDTHRELNQMEELILASPRIPLTKRTLVDEEKLLDLLDLLRLNLPAALEQAKEVIRQKEEILLQAEKSAQEVIEAAQSRATQLLSETIIVREAELEAEQLRQQVQQECDNALQQTLADIDRQRHQIHQELEEMRSAAIAECQEIQQGADEYADTVLKNIEQQFHEMLRVIQNGRQQLRE